MCNCQKPPCPLQGKCLTDNLVYQATVKSDGNEHTYVGLASTTFKLRLGNHKKAFNPERYRKDTSLSLFIWELINQGKTYDIEWRKIGRAQPFSPTSGECNLCTLEKFHLLFTPELQCFQMKPKSLGTFGLPAKPVIYICLFISCQLLCYV